MAPAVAIAHVGETGECIKSGALSERMHSTVILLGCLSLAPSGGVLAQRKATSLANAAFGAFG